MIQRDEYTQHTTEANPTSKQKNDTFFRNSQRIKLYHKVQEECIIEYVFSVKQSIYQTFLEWTTYIFSAGILFLVFWWFKEWRFRCFFSITSMDKAENVVVYGPDGDVQILKLESTFQMKKNSEQKKDVENDNKKETHVNDPSVKNMEVQENLKIKIFSYRFNKYQYVNGEFIPYGDSAFDYKNSEIVSTFKEGLSPEQIKTSIHRNGKNNTDIPDKGVMQLTFEEIFSPFYLFQVGSTILWLFEGYRIYAYIIICTSTISIMVKIYEERLNFARLKEFSFFRSESCTFRNGVKKVIDSQELCFGDKVFIREGEIAPCDLIVTKGSAIVNESMLTGESIPIVKTALSNNSDTFSENKSNLIYCGSLVQQVSSNSECLVIRVGFETLKGNLIRSILYPKSHSQISFKNDSGKFILILGSVALISFFVALPTFLEKIELDLMTIKDVIIRCFDLLTISVPPALPTCLSFGISFSLKRLRKRLVYCINPEKINICGIVRTICFDKTGTLTDEKLSFKLVSTYVPENTANPFREENNQKEISQTQKIIMSSCHSLMLFKGQNAGDPLDVEMFENSGASLREEGKDQIKQMINGNKVISEICFNGNKDDHSNNNTIAILKRFQFEPEVERMSSLISFENQAILVTKGSPEKIKTICDPKSIPDSFDKTLRMYTQEGYRVISLSYKSMAENEIDCSKERDHYEHSLTFAGFLIFENKLKPETIANIDLLLQKQIQIHMVTGDNPLTSLSVAKQCSILNTKQTICVLDSITEANQHMSTLDQEATSINAILQRMISSQVQFVMTGAFFANFIDVVKKERMDLFPHLLSATKVYARMKPDQKQSLIRLLQQYQNVKQGYSFIGMCGDGANDCQALKDADMGISLGEAEASIAASFTSKVTNISIIEFILREGRCCLATSFQCFKFMAVYSIIQCCTTAILYQRGAIPGDYQFLYWDLFIIIPLAFLIGLTDAADKLTVKTPSHRLFSHQNILSVVGLGIIQFIFLIISIGISAPQDWYISPLEINKMSGSDPSELLANSFDNAILFWISNFQYICSVISFSVGSQYKKPFYTNFYFTFFLFAIFTLSIYSLFSKQLEYTEFFQISAIAYDSEGNSMSVMPYNWRFVIGALIIGNMAINIIYEKYILNLMVAFIEKLFPSLVYHGTYVSQYVKESDQLRSSDCVKIELTETPLKVGKNQTQTSSA